MTANFFGPRDEWNVPGSELTFTAASELPRMLAPLEIDEIDEEDRDGHTADGTPKHWHVLHVLARPGGT